MPIRRSIEIETDAFTAYKAARKMLSKHVDGGAFEKTDDEPGRVYGIGWDSRLASARYRFEFEDSDHGVTAYGTLWLGGVFGAIHIWLRRWGNRRHLDKLLKQLKRSAEDRGGDGAGDRGDGVEARE